MIGGDDAGGFADGSVGCLMERDGGRLRSCRRALQEPKIALLIVEAIGNVFGEDLDLRVLTLIASSREQVGRSSGYTTIWWMIISRKTDTSIASFKRKPSER
jgi:hypothetical protein